MHWLAEQGLASKRVFLVVVPLIILVVVEFVKTIIKEDKPMNNKINTIDVLNVSLNVIENLSGNIAGGALLANALYENSDL